MAFYETDKRVTSLMIEVNRRLYLHSPGVKSGDFARIRSVVRTCIALAQ